MEYFKFLILNYYRRLLKCLTMLQNDCSSNRTFGLYSDFIMSIPVLSLNLIHRQEWYCVCICV